VTRERATFIFIRCFKYRFLTFYLRIRSAIHVRVPRVYYGRGTRTAVTKRSNGLKFIILFRTGKGLFFYFYDIFSIRVVISRNIVYGPPPPSPPRDEIRNGIESAAVLVYATTRPLSSSTPVYCVVSLRDVKNTYDIVCAYVIKELIRVY